MHQDFEIEHQIMLSEIDNREMHIPGYNFCGPGTKVGTRLIKGDTGINKLDNACKIHDVDYMRYAGSKEMLQESDKTLLNATKQINGLASWLVASTFKGKKLLEDINIINPVSFANNLSNSSIPQQNKYGEYLHKHYIERPYFKQQVHKVQYY